jgi:5-hydroxyisourate hydrolase-like protein (transthyretin family)
MEEQVRRTVGAGVLSLLLAIGLAGLPGGAAQAVDPVAALDVTVQDSTMGGNLEGASVILYESFQASEPNPLATVATGADGVAHFEFAAGHTVRIKIEAVGYFTKWGMFDADSGFDYSSADNYSLTVGGTTTVVSAMHKQFRTINVYAYDAVAGTDLGGVSVSLHTAAGDGVTAAGTTTTDFAGSATFQYDVGGLAKGIYKLRAAKPGYATQWLTGAGQPNDFAHAQEIDLSGDSTALDFDLALTSSGAVVTGSTPVISGTAMVGQVLHATAGAWTPSGVSLAYQWYRDGIALAASASSYAVQAADLGAHLVVRVVGSAVGYTGAALDSAPTAAVVAGTFTTAPKPKVAGILARGRKVRALVGAWSPAPASLTYQWYRGKKAIPNAHGRLYRLRARDVGTRIQVRVWALSPGFVTASTASAKTARVRR